MVYERVDLYTGESRWICYCCRHGSPVTIIACLGEIVSSVRHMFLTCCGSYLLVLDLLRIDHLLFWRFVAMCHSQIHIYFIFLWILYYLFQQPLIFLACWFAYQSLLFCIYVVLFQIMIALLSAFIFQEYYYKNYIYAVA